ncbi:branched-chain amino acid transport system substrate-binding protein [Rhodococcus sp. 27YEA15]
MSPELRDAALAAGQHINANGGIGGRQVEIVPCNGKNNPESNVKCATQFVNDGVVSVVGLDTQWGDNGVSIMERAGVVNQTVPLSHAEFASAVSFPLAGSTLTGGNAVAEYAARKSVKRASCIYPDTAVLKAACVDNFAPKAKELGIEDVQLIALPPTVTDVSQYVAKAAQSKAELVYSPASKQADVRMIQAAGQVGFSPEWVFSGSVAQPDFFSTLGDDAKNVVFWFDNKMWTVTGEPDVDVFNSVLEQHAPGSPINNNVVTVFSTLMTLKELGDTAGGDKMTRAELPDLLRGFGQVHQFMGPELDTSRHLPDFPTAYHTGSYLYKWDGGAFVPAGDGFFQFDTAS